MTEVTAAVSEVCMELDRALNEFPRFNSMHEGWAVIYEEMCELWRDVQRKSSTRDDVFFRREAARVEAKQVAAMAIRFMVELT